MKIYNYHPITFEFLSEGEAAEDQIIKNFYLIPAYSTTKQPPEAKEFQAAIFKPGDAEEWELVDDYRGKALWDKEKGEVYIIKKLGEKPDLEKYSKTEIIIKPVLDGKTLVNKIRSLFRGLPEDTRFKSFTEVESVLNFMSGDDAITEKEYQFNLNELKKASTLPAEQLNQMEKAIKKWILENYRWAE
jgi:hypothetical protein